MYCSIVMRHANKQSIFYLKYECMSEWLSLHLSSFRLLTSECSSRLRAVCVQRRFDGGRFRCEPGSHPDAAHAHLARVQRQSDDSLLYGESAASSCSAAEWRQSILRWVTQQHPGVRVYTLRVRATSTLCVDTMYMYMYEQVHLAYASLCSINFAITGSVQYILIQYLSV